MSKWAIQTERLGLRPFQLTDAEAFFLLNNNKEVIQYTGDPSFESVAHAHAFIAGYHAYQETGMGRWAVVDRETEAFIGFCGLKKHADGEVDLGYRFYKEVWGKGYATESSLACIDYAFTHLGLPSLIGRVAKQNLASIRVLEKCGFILESEQTCGTLPGWIYRLEKNFYNSPIS